MADSSEFRKSLERIAQLAFEDGYKASISALEKAAEKCPENKQAFLMSAEALRQIQAVCMEERFGSITKSNA